MSAKGLGAIISLLISIVPAFPNAEPLQQAERLPATEGIANGRFGRAVALGEDLALVSGIEYDSSGTPFGYVSEFLWDGGSWVDGQILRSDRPDDHFGRSLALDGDLLAVGAPGFCHIGEDSTSGQVRLFRRIGSTWEPEATITGPSCWWFGISLDLADEVLVVGSTFDHGGATGAFVYEPSEEGWQQTGRMEPLPDSQEQFGVSVATNGTSIVVGDPWLDESRAVVYQRQGDSWTQTAQVQGPASASGQGFGKALALDEQNLVVGSPGDTGSAYVYGVSDWVLEAELDVPDLESGDQFGSSVAVDQGRVVVGAPHRSVEDQEMAGVGFLFEHQGGSWVEVDRFQARSPGRGDQVTEKLALAGGRILAGASFEDTGCGEDAGAAYIFESGDGSQPEPARPTRCAQSPNGRGPTSSVHPGIASEQAPLSKPISGRSTAYRGSVVSVEVLLAFQSGGSRGIFPAQVSCLDSYCTWTLSPPPGEPLPVVLYEVRARGTDGSGNVGAWSHPAWVLVVG
jgi:hypothetical protein